MDLLVYWMIDWLVIIENDWCHGWFNKKNCWIDFINGWLVDWLINWLIVWLIDTLINCLIDWFFLISWLSYWLFFYLLIDWFIRFLSMKTWRIAAKWVSKLLCCILVVKENVGLGFIHSVYQSALLCRR